MSKSTEPYFDGWCMVTPMTEVEKSSLDEYIRNSDKRVAQWSKSQREAFHRATARLKAKDQ